MTLLEVGSSNFSYHLNILAQGKEKGMVTLLASCVQERLLSGSRFFVSGCRQNQRDFQRINCGEKAYKVCIIKRYKWMVLQRKRGSQSSVAKANRMDGLPLLPQLPSPPTLLHRNNVRLKRFYSKWLLFFKKWNNREHINRPAGGTTVQLDRR